MMYVVSLALFDPHISAPSRNSPPEDRPIKKALRTQISPGLIGGEIQYTLWYQLESGGKGAYDGKGGVSET